MKLLFKAFFVLLLANFSLAEEVEETAVPENEYENGCSNDLDDDMDGQIDSEDTDCEDEAILLLSDFDSSGVQPYLVWGVGIALLSSVGSDSGSGTATTD